MDLLGQGQDNGSPHEPSNIPASTSTTSISTLAVSSRTSSLACLECRRQHLRCDAGQPACRRCVGARRPCYYAPSRRGRKRRRDDNDTEGLTITTTTTTATPIATSTQFDSLFTFQSPLPQPQLDALVWREPEIGSTVNNAVNSADSDDLVDFYYTYFHRAHPFLVPRRFYHTQNYPRYLQLAVQFVGSHYAEGSERTELLRDRMSPLLSASSPRTVATIQALTMLAIALHARHELAESDRAVSKAVQLAVELGLQRRQFAAAHGRSIVEQESLRRTWWELYVVDGYLAALHHKDSFRSYSIVNNSPGQGVLLPCEEAIYGDDSLRLPPSPSLEDFDARVFVDEDVAPVRTFSSFAYRVDAVRLLGRVLSVTRTSVATDSCTSVDNALAAWTHHLHPSKREIVSRDGVVVDELLFQAHMLVSYASLVLHCPRSDLVVTLPAAARISCGQPTGALVSDSNNTPALHTAKATRASTRLTGLAALCSPVVQEHTPFFVCGLLLGATVQLAACVCGSTHGRGSSSSSSPSAARRQFRDSVLLAIGVLKTLGRTWALAHNALRLLRDVAGEVMQQTSADVVEDWGTLVGANATDDLPSPDLDALSQLDHMDQIGQWTLPLMLQLNDHPSSQASLC